MGAALLQEEPTVAATNMASGKNDRSGEWQEVPTVLWEEGRILVGGGRPDSDGNGNEHGIKDGDEDGEAGG